MSAFPLVDKAIGCGDLPLEHYLWRVMTGLVFNAYTAVAGNAAFALSTIATNAASSE